MLKDEPARQLGIYAALASTMALTALRRNGHLMDEELQQAQEHISVCRAGVERDLSLAKIVDILNQILKDVDDPSQYR